jgi:hypothetical protein
VDPLSAAVMAGLDCRVSAVGISQRASRPRLIDLLLRYPIHLIFDGASQHAADQEPLQE